MFYYVLFVPFWTFWTFSAFNHKMFINNHLYHFAPFWGIWTAAQKYIEMIQSSIKFLNFLYNFINKPKMTLETIYK